MTNDAVDILLVEDNPSDAELALRAFSKARLVPTIAIVNNGVEALDFLFGLKDDRYQTPLRKPKVICLDLKLPKVNGFEVLKRIKSEESTRSIPVVVMTSSPEDRDILESYRLGANSYVVKPANFEDFINIIGTVANYWLVHNQAPL